QVISFCLFGFIAIFLLFKLNYVSLELPKTSEMLDSLKFGVPLIPHILGMYVLTTIDRVIINNKLGLDNAGVYMLAYQLSLVAYMVFDALNKAYVPWLYEKLKRNNAGEKKSIVKQTYQYFVFLFIISLLMFPIIPFLVDFIVGENFKGVGNIVRWILIGQVFVGMYLMVVNYIFYSKDTRLLSMITIFSGGFHIGLTVILVDYFGLIGVAYAFSIAMFIRFLLTWFVAMKKFKMPWFSF
ncbi:lipopolysaccharide biosynthesis protein, partial [Vibrio sp. 10N.261.54.A5]|uniref:lipopolysaccharide biosynthesis protein n=1 Tax=Vibrio sp. 10N.261.54.A5 TaxID=3229686 RepID=UPI003552404B